MIKREDFEKEITDLKLNEISVQFLQKIEDLYDIDLKYMKKYSSMEELFDDVELAMLDAGYIVTDFREIDKI